MDHIKLSVSLISIYFAGIFTDGIAIMKIVHYVQYRKADVQQTCLGKLT